MRATHALLYKGFWGRSMDELKRQMNISKHRTIPLFSDGANPLRRAQS